MTNQWYAVCDKATGELKSTGTVLEGKLPEGLEAIPLKGRPDWSGEEWDAGTKSVIPLAKAQRPLTAATLLSRLTVADLETVLKNLGLTDERIAALKEG